MPMTQEHETAGDDLHDMTIDPFNRIMATPAVTTQAWP